MNKIKLAAVTTVIIIFLIGIYALIGHKKDVKTNENKTSDIVFTTDSKYENYLKVTIRSAIDNKNPDSIYNIYILCVDLPPESIVAFKRFETQNVRIYPVATDNALTENVGRYKVRNHVSRADLFKFFMPDIFPDKSKILYIDSDTLILGDLTSLFNTDISNKYLGAVLKYNPDIRTKYFGNIGFRKKIYTYNCGVLLYNLDKFRRDNIAQKLINAKNSDKLKRLMTQDAFNKVIPLRKIKKLSPVYNAYSRWRYADFKKYNFPLVYFPYCIGIKDIDDLYKKAVIVHFAGPKKPWEYNDINFSKEWHYYKNRLQDK